MLMMLRFTRPWRNNTATDKDHDSRPKYFLGTHKWLFISKERKTLRWNSAAQIRAVAAAGGQGSPRYHLEAASPLGQLHCPRATYFYIKLPVPFGLQENTAICACYQSLTLNFTTGLAGKGLWKCNSLKPWNSFRVPEGLTENIDIWQFYKDNLQTQSTKTIFEVPKIFCGFYSIYFARYWEVDLSSCTDWKFTEYMM